MWSSFVALFRGKPQQPPAAFEPSRTLLDKPAVSSLFFALDQSFGASSWFVFGSAVAQKCGLHHHPRDVDIGFRVGNDEQTIKQFVATVALALETLPVQARVVNVVYGKYARVPMLPDEPRVESDAPTESGTFHMQTNLTPVLAVVNAVVDNVPVQFVAFDFDERYSTSEALTHDVLTNIFAVFDSNHELGVYNATATVADEGKTLLVHPWTLPTDLARLQAKYPHVQIVCRE